MKSWHDKDYEWIPLERVGKFKFGEPCYNYDITMVKTPFDKADEDDTGIYYTDIQGVTLFVEDNIVDNIKCDIKLVFKNSNLIGMNIKDAVVILEFEPFNTDQEMIYGDSPEEDQLQKIYYFDELGIDLWCFKDEVVTAIVHSE